MVATVTGIAPYVSMIRQFLYDHANEPARRDGPRFFILHGASYQDEFGYDRELRRVSEAQSHLIQYIGSVSRPADPRNAGWSGPVGRINLILEDCLTRWSLSKEDTLVYLCGNPGMIEDAKARLLPKGWSIVEEQYWTR
jgi:NAD(P)H-flavin reductase